MPNINKISDEVRELIRRKSPDVLPDDPSASGWRSDEIRRTLVAPLLDKEGSAIAEINRIVTEVNGAINSLLSGTEGNETDTIARKVSMTYDQAKSILYISLLNNAGGTIPGGEASVSVRLGSAGIGGSAIQENHIADEAVTRYKLADGAVGSAKILPGAVTEEKLLDGSVTGHKLANGAVHTYHIIDKAVGTAQIKDYAIGYDQLDLTLKSNVNAAYNNSLDVPSIRSDVQNISKKIPYQATEANPLADRDFVNSSIATNTATFRGTVTSVAELQAISADNNDYAFVRHTDGIGNALFARYKYVAPDNTWVFEYELNNSSFTAEQWNTINSGATAEAIAEIPGLTADVDELKLAMANKPSYRLGLAQDGCIHLYYEMEGV